MERLGSRAKKRRIRSQKGVDWTVYFCRRGVSGPVWGEEGLRGFEERKTDFVDCCCDTGGGELTGCTCAGICGHDGGDRT